jgi:hypothetical protein
VPNDKQINKPANTASYKFLQNVGLFSMDYMMFYHRKYGSPQILLCLDGIQKFRSSPTENSSQEHLDVKGNNAGSENYAKHTNKLCEQNAEL